MEKTIEIQSLKNSYVLIQDELKSFKIWYELIKKVVHSDPLNEIYSDIVDLTFKKWGLSHLSIYLKDEKTNSLKLFNRNSKKNEFPIKINLDDKDQTINESFLNNKIVFQNNSHLFFPMRLYSNLIGVCCVRNNLQIKELKQKDTDSLEQLIQIISFSVYNKRKYSKTHLMLEKYKNLYDLTNRINSKIDLSSIIQTLDSYIIDIVNPDGYYISLLEDDKDNLFIEKANFKKKYKEMELLIVKNKISLKGKISQVCFDEKKILNLTEKNYQDYGENTKSIFDFWKLKNAVFIPIHSEEINSKPIGVICLFNHESYLSKKLIYKFQKILPLFAYPLQNALIFRKFSSLEQDFKETAETNKKTLEIVESISRLTSIQLIYEKILESIFNLFHFDIGLVFIKKNNFLEFTAGTYNKESPSQKTFEAIRQFFKKEKGYQISMLDGATAVCYIQNNFFYFKDLDLIKKMPMSKKDKEGIEILENSKSLVLAPILKNKEPIGVIQFWTMGKQVSLNDNDQAILKLLCSFIGTTIANAEIYSLVGEQNKILEEKNKIIQQKNKQLTEELKLAREIQGNLIPSKMPVIQGMRIAAYYKPMEQVGGDYYDFIPFRDNNQLGIFISDVSGHGVPAALITSMIKTLMETSGEQRQNPSELLSYINQKITGLTGGNFLTAFYAVYDRINKKIRFARGAHHAPFLIRGNEIIELNSRGKIMGIEKNIQFEQKEIDILKGDKILLYTDGLTDTTNSQGIMFEEFLPSKLLEFKDHPAEKYLESIYHSLVRHQDGIQFEDDVCLMVLEITE